MAEAVTRRMASRSSLRAGSSTSLTATAPGPSNVTAFTVGVGLGLGADALYEDVHDAAADLVFAVSGLGEVDTHHAGLAILQGLHRLGPDLGLATAAADGAAEGAVRQDQHVGAGAARRRAARSGDGRQDRRLALAEGFLQTLVNFVHRISYDS